MRFVILSVLLFVSTALQAQRFSTGLRTGIGFWKGAGHWDGHPENYSERHTVFEKELFVRYESKKHFACEVGINKSSTQVEGPSFIGCAVGMPLYPYTTNSVVKDQYYGLNIRLQYGITCGQIKGLSNYPGIVIAPSMKHTEYSDYIYKTGTTDYLSYNSTDVEMVAQLGIEDMVRYQLNRHIDLHTIVACRYILNGYLLRHAFTAQVGIAYRL